MDVATPEEHTVAALEGRHRDWPRATLTVLVGDAFDLYRSARVRAFVPLLVSHRVEAEMKALAAGPRAAVRPVAGTRDLEAGRLRFVRAVVVDVGAGPDVVESLAAADLAALDRIRRRGPYVVLVSRLPLHRLRRAAGPLLAHVDAVVAASGDVLGRRGEDPRSAPRDVVSARSAVLQVLHDHDIHHHDVLVVSGADGDPDLDRLGDVTVRIDADAVPGNGSLELHLPGPFGPALRAVLLALLDQGSTPPGSGSPSPATVSSGRHDRFPTAHANVVIDASGAGVSPVPALLRRWVGALDECVVMNVGGAGRDAELDRFVPPDGVIDVTGNDLEMVADAVRDHRPVVVLNFSQLAGPTSSEAVSRVLALVQAERGRTGRPHWLIIDGAELVLSDPQVAPHALDLSYRGHCLIMRRPEVIPASLASSIDITVS